MDGLQGQLKNGLAELIFHWVIWVKLLKKAFHKSSHSEEKADWAEILQKHAYGQSTGTVNKCFGWGHFSSSYLSKITQKSIPLSPHIVKKKWDRAKILQKHAYGQSTWTVKKMVLADAIIHWVIIWVKLFKKHSLSPNVVKKKWGNAENPFSNRDMLLALHSNRLSSFTMT